MLHHYLIVAAVAVVVVIAFVGVYYFERWSGTSVADDVEAVNIKIIKPAVEAVGDLSVAVPVPAATPAAGSGSPAASAASDPAAPAPVDASAPPVA